MNRTKFLYLFLLLTMTLASCIRPQTTPLSSPEALPSATDAPTVTDIPATPTTAKEIAPTSTATDLPTPSPTLAVASMPDPNSAGWVQVASGFNRPVAMVPIMDDSGRLLILEQPGTIRVLQNGTISSDAFLDIRDRVGSAGNEQGLLGIALAPDFNQSGAFYLDYTNKKGDTVIARFKAGGKGMSSADPSTEKILLTIDQPFANHNGGQLAFGPDGYLYIGMGDGGSQGDPHGNGQSTNALLGKIMRIDVSQGDPYAIPSENPFANGGGSPEVFAMGLRNPWRFSFDQITGDLFIADVGQNQWEEIDRIPSGYSGTVMNFGWNIREGNHDYAGGNSAGLTDPIAEYDHDWGCSVTGGYVYRGQAVPGFAGVYLYGDYCSGIIWGLIPQGDGWQSKELYRTNLNISSFGLDQQGELYLLDLNGGVYKLQPN